MKKWTAILAVLLAAALVVCCVLGVNLSNTKKTVAENEAKIAELESNAATLTEEKAAAETEIESLKAEIETAKGENETLKGEVETANGELETLKAEKEELTTQIDALQGEIGLLKTEAENNTNDIAAKDAKIAELEGAAAEKEELIKGIEAKVAEKEAEIAALETAAAEKEELIKGIEAKVAEKEAEIAALTEKVEGYENAIAAQEAAKLANMSGNIVILATSDIHCGIDTGFAMDGVFAIRKALAEKNSVLLVDVGDAIQGEPVGTMTKGEAIINIMNAAAYDVATLGNHEFDYGLDRLFELIEMADYPYVSCNFNKEGEAVLPAYVIKDVEGVKVAFVGISTPWTLSTSTPTYFQDAEGNYLYGFLEGETGDALYAAVQNSVDAARAEGAQVVVALAHLGNEENCHPFTSMDVIAATNGIDVLFDGHEHASGIKTAANKDGNEISIVSVGTKLSGLGCVTISAEGELKANVYYWDGASTGSYAALTGVNNEVSAAMDAATADLNKELAKVIAVSEFGLYIYDPIETDARLIRKQETNLGDLVADAYRAAGNAEVAFSNGGGIRVNVAAGEITMNDIYKVNPFGNTLCVAKVKGQQILDALEWTSRSVPDQNGGFLQTSGLTYEIHTYIESSATQDEYGMCTGFTGEYRVKNVFVNGEPLDPEREYTVCTTGYILKDAGDGNNLMVDNTMLVEDFMIDNQALLAYVNDTMGGTIDAQYAEPYGQGRIVIVTKAPEE